MPSYLHTPIQREIFHDDVNLSIKGQAANTTVQHRLARYK
jgi:hypothetical protein